MSNYRDWKIKIETERDIWKQHIIGTFIILAEICPYCKYGAVKLKNTNNINSPLEGKCNFYKCTRNINLRENTIFEKNSKTPFSVIYKIIKLWLVDSMNVNKISTKLKEECKQDNIDRRFIYQLISTCRKAIATHLRNVYSLFRLANRNALEIVCVDESLFTHKSGDQQWVVGLINTLTNELRLELVEDRSENTLKTIIEKNVAPCNVIYSDSWSGYNFLSRPNSGYQHNVANHHQEIFGLTSRIEGVWGEIKSLIKNMYFSIHSSHFIYFLKEAEYRRCIKNLNPTEKIKDFANVLLTVGINQFLDEDDLIILDYQVNFDD